MGNDASVALEDVCKGWRRVTVSGAAGKTEGEPGDAPVPVWRSSGKHGMYPPMNKAGSTLIQSLDRAFSILELFLADNAPLGVTAISERVGLHKSTCFGLINTLEHLGYLLQDRNSGKYSLGLKTLVLGQAYLKSQDIRRLAAPAIESLVSLAQEYTIHLVVREKDHLVYLDKYEGPNAMVIVASSIGQRAVPHCTGVGKAVLAFMPPEEQRKILAKPLQAFTPYTLTDTGRLLAALAEIRKQGFAFDDQERALGLRCVAAPFFGNDGIALGAISISGPSIYLSRERMLELSKPVKAAAETISRAYGYAGA